MIIIIIIILVRKIITITLIEVTLTTTTTTTTTTLLTATAINMGQKSSLVLTIPTIGMALLVYIEPVDQTTLLIRKRNEEDTE